MRKLKESDYKLIANWTNEPICKSVYPLDSSYITENDGKPIVIAVCYLYNTEAYAQIEGLIGNPKASRIERKEASGVLVEKLEDMLKRRGYKRVLCYTNNKVLENYYAKRFGYKAIISDLVCLVKEIS